MKTWLLTTPVVSAKGHQTWRATAETKEEARAVYERGDAEFVAEEVEVLRIGDPEIWEES